jgi:phosphatidylglycerol:prolipoprotein diacylglycerol transferase
LLGQAVARPANFINQELYGQPTNLPWGIKIDAQHRIAPWNDITVFTEETTRFHPTFAYEILWNFIAMGVLLIVSRKYEEKLKPGVIFGGWLILAGVGRNIIEFFRPDQPVIPGTAFSYSRLVAVLMIIAGTLLILIKYHVLKIGFISPGRDSYLIIQSLEERNAITGNPESEPDDEELGSDID